MFRVEVVGLYCTGFLVFGVSRPFLVATTIATTSPRTRVISIQLVMTTGSELTQQLQKHLFQDSAIILFDLAQEQVRPSPM